MRQSMSRSLLVQKQQHLAKKKEVRIECQWQFPFRFQFQHPSLVATSIARTLFGCQFELFSLWNCHPHFSVWQFHVHGQRTSVYWLPYKRIVHFNKLIDSSKCDCENDIDAVGTNETVQRLALELLGKRKTDENAESGGFIYCYMYMV